MNTKVKTLCQSLVSKWDMTSWYPILVGCLIVWFLGCNKTSAEFIIENKTVLAITAIIIYSIVLGVVLYRKKDTHTILGMIFFGGFLLRAFYVLTAPYDTSKHDLGLFAGFDTAESGYGHLGYIEYLYKNFRLADFDPRMRLCFYQPPGFYIVAAIILDITTLFHVDAPLCYESIQIVTLFFSSLTVWTGYRIIKEFSVSDRWVLLLTAFLAAHPFYSIMSVTLTNDCMAMYLMALAIWYTIRWQKSPEMKKILVVALAVGLAMMTKLNAAIISFGIGFVFIYVFWKNRQQWKSYLLQFIAFLAVCAPIGLFYPVRNLLCFQMPVSYIQKVNINSPMYISGVSIWSRLGLPSLEELATPFWEVLPDINNNVWSQAIKTSLVDEIVLDAGNSLFQTTAQLALWIGVLLAVMMNLALIRSYGKDYGKKTELHFFLLIEYVVMLISYAAFCLQEPFLCTMNFRYIPVSFWFPVLGTAFWLQKNQQESTDNERTDKHQKKGIQNTQQVFRSVLICAICVFIVLSVLVDLNFVVWSEINL